MNTQETAIKKNKFFDFMKNNFSVPNSVALMVILVFAAVIATHFVSGGEYTRVKDPASGRMVVDPATFHYIKSIPANILQVPLILFKALGKAADIIFFCFMSGGCMEIILRTGAFGAITNRICQTLEGKEVWVIPTLMGLFSIGGFTFGMSVEAIGFTPLIVRLVRRLGFDALVGVGIIIFGCNVGFTAGILNAFSVGLSQAILQLPLFSGAWYRIIIELVLLAVTSLFLMRYARKVKNDPAKSYLANIQDIRTFEENEVKLEKMTIGHYLVLVVMVVGFSAIVYGSLYLRWFLAEIAAVFFAMGALSGFAVAWGPSRVARVFTDGVKSMVFGVLLIGFARGVLLVMEDAKILDTIIHNMAVWVGTLPPSIIVLGLFVFCLVISVLITSGSGMAMVTMPILGPLVDIFGLTRQMAVLMFQFADGFTNNILPTSATTMSVTGMANIPYDTWMKLAWPMFLIHMLLSVIFIYIALLINY
jgi:uncharacterized ion transporter superfamily protein YfcC